MFNIKNNWLKILSPYFQTQNWKNLEKFIKKEYKEKIIYPEYKNIFKAFKLTDFKNIKVVIIGQDPYHNHNEAEGLSFSVPKNFKLPPSLKNIYKEIETDLKINKDFTNGNLFEWSNQGILLLNSILTVQKNKPASHHKKGWEDFTDFIIKEISEKKENIVFILWGNYAQKKEQLINTTKHLVLKSNHPSPFSAYKGFFGCKHFSKTNKYLKKNNKKEMKW